MNIKEKLIEYRKISQDLNNLGNETLNALKKSILQRIHDNEDVVSILTNKFINDKCFYGGTDYFTYQPKNVIQQGFQEYVKDLIKSDDKFMVFRNQEIYLSEIYEIPSTRNIIENKTFSFNENGNLVYTYTGTSLNGFNRIEKTIAYDMIIDIDKMKIIDYTAARRNGRANPDLNYDFLNDIIKNIKNK